MTTLIIILLILAAAYFLLQWDPHNQRSTTADNTDRTGTAGDFKMWIIRGSTGKKELLVDQPNTIQGSFRNELSKALDAAGGPLMDTANLFTDDEDRHTDDGGSGTQDGKDGIVIIRDQNASGGLDPDAYTMITTEIAASNTYGKRFKGTITFSQSLTLDEAWIGENFRGEEQPAPAGADNYFVNAFAHNTFTAVPVQAADKIIIEWELYITP